MNINICRSRRLAAAIALMVLTCGAPSRAWCASANLWVALDDGGGIESYTPEQLKTSGAPAPKVLSTYPEMTGLAFDKSHNLWTVFDGTVARFTAAQLKKLSTDPNPTAGVIITSASTFNYLYGCNFDRHGNLWVVDYDNDSIDELSKAQLAEGSRDVTPAIVITSSDLDRPNFVTFDKAGNAWVDNESNSTLVEFSASQLTSGGSKPAAVVLSTDGSDSLYEPGEIAFDKHGNLWVPNYDADTVVEFAKTQLTSSGAPTPAVTLSSAVFSGGGPWGAVFDSKGDLVSMNYDNGTIAKFTPNQLKASGAPVPTVTVTGTQNDNYQIIFGPAS